MCRGAGGLKVKVVGAAWSRGGPAPGPGGSGGGAEREMHPSIEAPKEATASLHLFHFFTFYH